MNKDKFFEKAGFRSVTFKKDGTSIVLRELSLAQRRTILECKEGDYPVEAIAALTVAMSCPEFTENDVEALVEQVRPEILVAAAEEVFLLSGMIPEAKKLAKKSSEPRKGGLRFAWLWHWVKPLKN